MTGGVADAEVDWVPRGVGEGGVVGGTVAVRLGFDAGGYDGGDVGSGLGRVGFVGGFGGSGGLLLELDMVSVEEARL